MPSEPLLCMLFHLKAQVNNIRMQEKLLSSTTRIDSEKVFALCTKCKGPFTDAIFGAIFVAFSNATFIASVN